MTRLSSHSIERAKNAALNSFELAYKDGSGFAILCDIRPGALSTGVAPLSDGKGFSKFYESKVYAVRAIQRLRPEFSSVCLNVRHDYFGV